MHSVEHGAVKVVAVNDPFIDPEYAVSSLPAASGQYMLPPNSDKHC